MPLNAAAGLSAREEPPVLNTEDYLSDEDDPVIEDMSPATIAGVASRLLASDTFEELVYRECELDALWTLADIAIVAMPDARLGERACAFVVAREAASLAFAEMQAFLQSSGVARSRQRLTLYEPVRVKPAPMEPLSRRIQPGAAGRPWQHKFRRLWCDITINQ